MSKIVFISGAYLGCHYVRCHLPALANGWLTNYYGLSDKSLKPVNIVAEEMLKAETVVFHRANTGEHHRTAMELKRAGKNVVFDNDDTYILDKGDPFYGLDEAGFEQNIERTNNVINNFIINSDLVTCSTEYLAKEYRKLNKNVVVVPNMINPEDWDKPLRNTGKKVRIGVVGSTAYYGDFHLIEKELTALDKDPRVQLVMFGLQDRKTREENPITEAVHKKEYGFWDTLENIERVPWCPMEEYFSTLNELKLDILLIPRRESYFNKCKSNIKFLESSMLEIPIVTNYFKDCPYEIDRDYVIWAKNWLEDLEPLIQNKVLRRGIGKRANKYVLKNYNIWKQGSRYEDIYDKIKYLK